MNEELALKEWLNQEPLPEEIRRNIDGSSYLPIENVKPKLDYLSSSWSTKNFTHFFHKTPDNRMIVSGSVELVIEYYEFFDSKFPAKIITRTLSGAATFDVQDYYPNTHYGQTCLSLCIVAAAKELGKFFGRDLNKERLTVPSQVTGKIKKEPDLMIKKQMENAILVNDQSTIENLNKTYSFG